MLRKKGPEFCKEIRLGRGIFCFKEGAIILLDQEDRLGSVLEILSNQWGL
jgi:hypothetical protein